MNFEEKVLTALSALTDKVDSIDSRLAKVEAVQTKQGEQLAKQGEQINRIEGRLDTMDGRLDAMDKHLKEVDERSLRNGILLENDVAAKVQAVLDGHDALARQIDALATQKQVDELADDVGIIKSVVTQHSREIHELQRAQ